MIASYLKTSVRNIVRNKLFSGINITGLAIGMSVGLFVIALIHDIISYDRFHEKSSRIFRITTTRQIAGQPAEQFASASVKIGEIGKKDLASVEDVAILRKGFGGDATAGEITIPISGLWADGSFLNLFTFPFLNGDPATSLTEPHSVVLTQKTANKLFGSSDALGRVIRLDSLDYKVTGVMRDVPFFSHLQFDALASFSTLQQVKQSDPAFLSWQAISDTYVYLLLPEKADFLAVANSLKRIDKQQNAALKDITISTKLQPLTRIFLGEDLQNEIGHSLPTSLLWAVIALALVAILTACFNYTNLSIARSLRRSREVGVRKVLGAFKSQVMAQFVVESVIVSLLSLIFAIVIFFSLRSAFLSLGPSFATLQLSPIVIAAFVCMSVTVGILAGILPAVSLAGVNPLTVLKNTHSLKLFRFVSLRKALIFLQYTFSLFFVAVTIIIYNQYQYFTSQDLGFQTKDIININLQGNQADRLRKAVLQIPGVQQTSQSQMLSGLGPNYSAYFKSDDPRDSTATDLNGVDENFVPLHAYEILAGRNFLPKSAPGQSEEILINQQLLKHFNLGNGDPQRAVGQILHSKGKQYEIVGVLKDFHYNSLYAKIGPALLKYAPWEAGYLNVKVSSGSLTQVEERIRKQWKNIDPVHPYSAASYKDDIAESYKPVSFISKIIGVLAFLTLFIACMGLFGMVVFTVETRVKEVSVRKVLGASESSIVYMLSKGFLSLLFWAAIIALTASYFLFERFVLAQAAYHAPIPMLSMLACMILFMLMALMIIGSQTVIAARSNPAEVLKAE